jgi:2-polyprenyl-3-methyl-5-hydroxy-6-metoxy-1,4-benzoquinol methylase
MHAGRPVSRPEFDAIYQRAVAAVYDRWTPKLQAEIAAHCFSWSVGQFDFRQYLELSALRFYRAYRCLAASAGVRTVCDIGGFWGVCGITLASLGFDVSMTESLEYYGSSFRELFECAAERGVKIADYDPFKPAASAPGTFDAVLAMAILEHYADSPRSFMENVVRLMRPGGLLYVEVPNIAYWPKRLALLRGLTPLPPIDHIYKSAVPFTGHHHEYTRSELRDLVRLGGMEIVREDSYNYSDQSRLWSHLRRPRVAQVVASVVCRIWPETRECLTVLCQKQAP